MKLTRVIMMFIAALAINAAFAASARAQCGVSPAQNLNAPESSKRVCYRDALNVSTAGDAGVRRAERRGTNNRGALGREVDIQQPDRR